MRISDWSSDVCSSDLRSLALNPKLADGFIALGFSDYYGRLDYDAALTAFATAQRLRPNDAGAMAAASYVYRRQGRIADAIRKQEEALDHDQRNTRFVANQAANYMMVRRYEIGRAHVGHPVTKAQPVCRLPMDKNK